MIMGTDQRQPWEVTWQAGRNLWHLWNVHTCKLTRDVRGSVRTRSQLLGTQLTDVIRENLPTKGRGNKVCGRVQIENQQDPRTPQEESGGAWDSAADERQGVTATPQRVPVTPRWLWASFSVKMINEQTGQP